jgi:hypothetical protein
MTENIKESRWQRARMYNRPPPDLLCNWKCYIGVDLLEISYYPIRFTAMSENDIVAMYETLKADGYFAGGIVTLAAEFWEPVEPPEMIR